MFCGADNLLQNIPYNQSEWWNILQNIISLREIVMELNNVMSNILIIQLFKKSFEQEHIIILPTWLNTLYSGIPKTSI